MIVIVRGKNGLHIFFDQMDKRLELYNPCDLSTFSLWKRFKMPLKKKKKKNKPWKYPCV